MIVPKVKNIIHQLIERWRQVHITLNYDIKKVQTSLNATGGTRVSDSKQYTNTRIPVKQTRAVILPTYTTSGHF